MAGLMLENSSRKRPLHAYYAPDLRRTEMNNRVKTISSYLPSFEPIPTSEIGIEYHARRDREEHNPAPRSHLDGDDSTMPTADDYANLLFYESSDEDETTNTTTTDATAVDEPAHVVVATGMPSRGYAMRGGGGGRRVSFAPFEPTVHHLVDVPTARDMTPDEVSNLWIRRSDLEAYRSDAHSIAQDARDRILLTGEIKKEHRRNAMMRSFMSDIERESDHSIRGLEKRLMRRLRHTRRKVTRDVLEYQANVVGLRQFGYRGMGGSEMAMLLAKVSRERSVNARKLAFVDAMEDRMDVLNDCI